MPNYTDRYSIPYPVAGDPIHLGAEHMGELAREVDKTLSQVSDASALDATSSATPGRIVQRDASGRARVADPSHASDIANKGTVDAAAGAVDTRVDNISTRLGGLSFQKRTTPPTPGTSSDMITFVAP